MNSVNCIGLRLDPGGTTVVINIATTFAAVLYLLLAPLL